MTTAETEKKCRAVDDSLAIFRRMTGRHPQPEEGIALGMIVGLCFDAASGLVPPPLLVRDPRAFQEHDSIVRKASSFQEKLSDALRSVLGFLYLLQGNSDIPMEIRELLATHYSVIDAIALVGAPTEDWPRKTTNFRSPHWERGPLGEYRFDGFTLCYSGVGREWHVKPEDATPEILAAVGEAKSVTLPLPPHDYTAALEALDRYRYAIAYALISSNTQETKDRIRARALWAWDADPHRAKDADLERLAEKFGAWCAQKDKRGPQPAAEAAARPQPVPEESTRAGVRPGELAARAVDILGGPQDPAGMSRTAVDVLHWARVNDRARSVMRAAFQKHTNCDVADIMEALEEAGLEIVGEARPYATGGVDGA